MKSVLLHVGLPKTATSTLQSYFFPELHGKHINFIGKYLNTAGNQEIRNDGRLIIEYIHSHSNQYTAHQKVRKLLKKGILNVYSDERIFIDYPGTPNLFTRLEKLQYLFSIFDTKILICLRNPVDLFVSLYIQTYPGFFQNNKQLNTLQKYTQHFLENPDSKLFDIFRYRDWLKWLTEHFSTVDILLFEDLIHSRAYYLEAINSSIGLPPNSISSQLLEIDKTPKKSYKKGNGYLIQPEILSDKFGFYINSFRKHRRVYEIFHKIYNSKYLGIKPTFRKFINHASKIHIGSGKIHSSLSPETNYELRQELFRVGKLNSSYFDSLRDKMMRYNYIIKEKNIEHSL